jgi:PAP2 superfamily protein
MGEASTAVRERPTTSPAPEVGGRPVGRRLNRVAKETVIVLALVGVYELLRTDMVQDGSQATAHALSVVRVESALGLFHEVGLQRLFLRVPDLVKACNLYYGGTHFVVPTAALIWLALRHPGRYARARTALGATSAVAFAIFWVFPVAPPRLLPARYGIIDTLVTFHQSGHLEHSLVDSAGDIYAAMPSLHVAWALWCTLVLYPVVRHQLVRILLVAYPLVTTVVVVATGNHFFTDAVSGALLVSLLWVVLPPAGAWLAGAGRSDREYGHLGATVQRRRLSWPSLRPCEFPAGDLFRTGSVRGDSRVRRSWLPHKLWFRPRPGEYTSLSDSYYYLRDTAKEVGQ